jgi:hypothetical protein
MVESSAPHSSDQMLCFEQNLYNVTSRTTINFILHVPLGKCLASMRARFYQQFGSFYRIDGASKSNPVLQMYLKTECFFHQIREER